MNQIINLWPTEVIVEEDTLTTGFTLEGAGYNSHEIRYQLPSEWQPALSRNSDPFVIAAIFSAMEAPADLRVHGSVSPSLLRNLEEFQAAWSSWAPQRYRVIDIYADEEEELTPSKNPGAIMTFSGGVDSSFTAFRHHSGKAGRFGLDIQAGLALSGPDVPKHNRETLIHFQDKSKQMLGSLGMTLIPLATNLETIAGEHRFTFLSFLNSCLALFQEGFSAGVSGSSHTYENLLYHWFLPNYSNSLSDPFLCSKTFPILIDGAGFSKFEKVQTLAEWPEAMQNLCDCLKRDGKNNDRNCCRCEGCVSNMLAFRTTGLGLPPCFEKDISNANLLKLDFSTPNRIKFLQEVLRQAKANQVKGSWIGALRAAILINQVKAFTHQSRFLHQISHRVHQ